MGAPEHVIPIPVTFKVNLRDGFGNGPDTVVTVPPGGGIPAVVLTIPRRNNGPIVADLGGGQVISVQYTGFSGTRELETFRLLNRARNVDGLQDGARVLRRRLAELHLRRHRRQHRLLHDQRSAAARGPAGGHRDRRAALVHPQRAGRQRVAEGPEPRPVQRHRLPLAALERAAADRQPEERLRRERQQRHRRARRSTTTR